MMPSLTQFITSALYVTFVTASIGFGALYYRKVVDDLELKSVKLGEELYCLFDPKAFIGIGIFAFFFCIFVLLLSMKTDLLHEEMNMSAPGLVLMVVPMVLLTNMVQLYLRARWQRLSVRSYGILIRRMLSEKRYELYYDSGPMTVFVEREFLWFRMRFVDATNCEIAQCALSASGLTQLVQTIKKCEYWQVRSDGIDLSGVSENSHRDFNDSQQ